MARMETVPDFILDVLAAKFGRNAPIVLKESPLLQYIEIKTRSAATGSKARGSFASLYAIYVLIENYVAWRKAHPHGDYKKYEGMRFSKALARQRTLPFGEKLQNHALNSRCNEEFRRFFPRLGELPIIRDLGTKRYWFNEKFLEVKIAGKQVDIAHAILAIIDKYIKLKRSRFEDFFAECEKNAVTCRKNPAPSTVFIFAQLDPNVDARIFEIVSFAILKYAYWGKKVYFGSSPNTVEEAPILLFKTGRTNANDGGIDFVMRPYGRFFQVTEVLDFRKYFLDIDKINRFPITFVIKTTLAPADVSKRLKEEAATQYKDADVLKRYLSCFEEIVTIPTLRAHLAEVVKRGNLPALLHELVIQCKVEYNIP